jgi:hypothetical protein
VDRAATILTSTILLWPTLLALLAHTLSVQAESAGYELGRLSLPPSQPANEALVIEPVVEFQVPESEQRITPERGEPQRQRGIRVPKSTVLRLARSQAMPESVTTPAQNGRPAGLELTDIESFSVGLRNGDVLTRVAGVPAINRGTVISTVVAVRETGAGSITGEFWRDGAAWKLIVEMPYLPESSDEDGADANAAMD